MVQESRARDRDCLCSHQRTEPNWLARVLMRHLGDVGHNQNRGLAGLRSAIAAAGCQPAPGTKREDR